MTMPKTTRVMGQKYTVVLKPGLSTEHPHAEGMSVDLLGLCDSNAQTIWLEPYQGVDRIRETFLHEHLHAMLGVVGLSSALGENEEEVVKRLSPVLFEFLRRNPRAVQFLTETT